jgi:hypothetical protein
VAQGVGPEFKPQYRKKGKKVQSTIAYDPAIPLMGGHPKE